MYKLYIIVFGSNFNTEELRTFLDKSLDIEFWFISLPNSIFVKSALDATSLYKLIEQRFSIVVGSTHSIFITEVSSANYFGRLDPEHWQYFKNREIPTVRPIAKK